jgi:predicted small lipoprotein YifL
VSRLAVIVMLAILFVGGLSACGKKGPLEAPGASAAVAMVEAARS